MKKILITFLLAAADAKAACPYGYTAQTYGDSEYKIAVDDICPYGFTPATDPGIVISSGDSTGNDAKGSYSIVCDGAP